MRRRAKKIFSILLEAGQKFVDDRAPRLGAALSFYTVISLTPLLVVIVGIAGWVYGEDAARGEVVAQIEGMIGREAAVLVEEALRQAHFEGDGLRVAIIGGIGLLIGATTLFWHLKLALNSIWGVEEKENTRGIIGAVRNLVISRLVVLVVVVGLGFVLLASLVATAAIEAGAAYFADVLPLPPGTMRLLNTAISLGIATMIFAYMYRALPDARIRWREVWLGALVTAFLFTVGKHLIGIYLGRGAVGSAYGAAGSLVVLLVWVYYSAQIFFFGAEVTQVYASRYGPGWRVRRGFTMAEGALVPQRVPAPPAGNMSDEPGESGAPERAPPT